MPGWFDSAEMAAGYARSRPPVHVRAVELVRRKLAVVPVSCALDVGCGAGLSTAPLAGLARRVLGLDPQAAMLGWARRTAPGASFIAARAEAMPFRPHSIDLITAAGSLDFVDRPRFFPEARRVLVRGGRLVVYDFGQGRDFTDSGALSAWFAEFERRYPRPRYEAVDRERLGAEPYGLTPEAVEQFEAEVPMSAESYVNYLMTEVNVEAAAEPRQSIRTWCSGTLRGVFGAAAHPVRFTGYIAWMAAA